MTTTLLRSKVAAPSPRFSRHFPGIPLLVAPPPENMTEQAQRIAFELVDVGYAMGRQQGHLEGYLAAEADMAALQRQAAAISRNVGVPYAALADRRGDHARATSNRQLLRERGISFDPAN